MSLVRRAEQKHTAIKKAWGTRATVLTDQSLDRRIALSKTLGHDTSLAVVWEYVGVLRRLGEITEALKTINALTRSSPWSMGPPQDVHGFWSGRESVSVQELNKVVPLFFSLQLHCRGLYFALGAPRSELTKKALQDRAQAGGAASNAGEVVLRERVLCHLMLLPSGKEWKSLSKFFEESRVVIPPINQRGEK